MEYGNDTHNAMKDIQLENKKRRYESIESHKCIMFKEIGGINAHIDIRLGVMENFNNLKKIVEGLDGFDEWRKVDDYELYWSVYDCFIQVCSTSDYKRVYCDPETSLPF